MGLPITRASCVDARVGKGWAKGLTAATDARIAQRGAIPRGPRGRYRRHVPYEKDRRLRGYRTLPLEWSQIMAYVVGLLATDGCLSKDRRHIILTSCDRQLVQTYLECLGRPIRWTVVRKRRRKPAYYAQFSDVAFYD